LNSKPCPANRVKGRETFDTVNCDVFGVIAEIVTLVCPLFVTVTSNVSVWPTITSPKRKFDGVLASWIIVAPAFAGKIPRRAATVPMVMR